MRTWLERWKRPLMGWTGLACVILALVIDPGSGPAPAAQTPPPVASAPPTTSTPSAEIAQPTPADITQPAPPAPVASDDAALEIRLIIITLGIALICMALPRRTWSGVRTWWRTADDTA